MTAAGRHRSRPRPRGTSRRSLRRRRPCGVVERGRLVHHQVRRSSASSSRRAGAGSPGSCRWAGRTLLAPSHTRRALTGSGRGRPARAMRMRSVFMPCRMYSKPLPSSPMRSPRAPAAVEETWFESTACRPSSRSRALRCSCVEVGVEQREPGAGARQEQYFFRHLRVEIQTFWPLTM